MMTALEPRGLTSTVLFLDSSRDNTTVMESDPKNVVQEMADLEEDMTIAYVHNVSHKKPGDYFECQLQTHSKTVRAVCFSPKKRKEMMSFSQNDTPVKIKKFCLETKCNTEDIVIDDETTIEKCDISFEKQILPVTKMLQISALKSLSVGQLVTVKGKVISTKPLKDVKTNLKMMEVHIVDNSEGIKLILWQEYIEQVQLNSTYIFENVRIKTHTTKKFTLTLLRVMKQRFNLVTHSKSLSSFLKNWQQSIHKLPKKEKLLE